MKKPIISKYFKNKNMSAKTIDVGIAERIQLVGVFNQVKGDIETLEAVLGDVKEVSLSEDEKKEINFHEVKDENGVTTSLAWDKTPLKSVSLSEKTVAFVKKFVDEKSKSETLTLADNAILEVYNKLK